jgi:hypothetical protein
MSLKAAALISLLAAPVLAPANAQAKPPAQGSLSGTYVGVYKCSGNLMGATLDLHVRGSKAKGSLAFYPLMLNPQPQMANPVQPSGSFKMKGTVKQDLLTLQPGDWIQKPATNYGAAGIKARITDERIEGTPVGPDHWACTAIQLVRLPGMR